MLALSERPSALAQQLFGWRPLRLHRQQITPDRENPVDRRYWRSKLEAKLHTDGPRFGIPPSALFMFCEHPPAEGGDFDTNPPPPAAGDATVMRELPAHIMAMAARAAGGGSNPPPADPAAEKQPEPPSAPKPAASTRRTPPR